MLLSYIILAISVSIDALGIGITYGFRNTKISNLAKIVLFVISVFITWISVFIGDGISKIFSESFTAIIGTVILVGMGFFMIYQALNNKKKVQNIQVVKSEPKIYRFFIEFLGITIQIIRNPISSDLDNSKKIDVKEAFYIGIALSIDSICIGICSSIIGFTSILFPILVATFQLAFLSFGKLLGEKISSISNIPENIWNVLSGILLICIGISKLVI